MQLPSLVQAAEWPATLSLSTLNGATGFRLEGTEANDASGRAVAPAGDVNGDGFDDVIIGAYGADTNGPTPGDLQGISYVVFGKASGFDPAISLSALDGFDGFRLEGKHDGDQSGYSVSAAGDVNGDGYDDVIIGAKMFDANGIKIGTRQGASFVVFGKATNFASVVNLDSLNGTTGFRLDGVAAEEQSGRSVSKAGDVNGDGFGDVIVGADKAEQTGFRAGSSYVVFGKPGGFSATIPLASLNGSTGFRLDGVTARDYSGYSVSAAGDVNGDGFDDVIVGAYGADPSGVQRAGSTYVVFGKPGSFASVINLSTLNGATGFRLDGMAEYDHSGASVAAAGDVNGDGMQDILIGAYAVDSNGNADSGSSYVVFGSASGFASTINLSTLNGTTGFRLNGVAQDDFGGFSVSGAGDVNGDGFSDLIIGAYLADINGAVAGIRQGASYVVFGKAKNFASIVNLSSLNGTSGFRLDGIANDDRSGYSVSAAGDVNGDGLHDVIVGASEADPGNLTHAGTSYVVFGRAPDASVSRTGAAASQTISGGAFKDVLSGAGGADTLEGRAGGDKLHGDAGANTASYAHAPSGVVASLANPSSNTGHALGDRYFDIKSLLGSLFADTLTGDGKANRLTGGRGKDKLKGASGKDTYAYRLSSESRPGSKADIIIGFNPGTKSSAVDKIDLSGIDAKTGIGGNQAFTYRGTKSFTGPGQVRLKKSGDNIIIQGNTGGSKSPEFEIVLKGLASKAGRITAKDFKL